MIPIRPRALTSALGLGLLLITSCNSDTASPEESTVDDQPALSPGETPAATPTPAPSEPTPSAESPSATTSPDPPPTTPTAPTSTATEPTATAPRPGGGVLERVTLSGQYRLAIPNGYVARAPNVDVLSDPQGDTTVAVHQALWVGEGPQLIQNVRLAITSYPVAWATGSDADELQGHLSDLTGANPALDLVSQQPVTQAGLHGLEYVYRLPVSWGITVTRARAFRVGGDFIVIEGVAGNLDGSVTPEQITSDPAVTALLDGFLWSATRTP